MPCKKPFVRGVMEFGCGQCLSCKISKKKMWKHRIMLEAKSHKDNAFLTLTYSDENLPEGGTLDPKDTKLFLHRLRKNLKNKNFGKIRYFLVGEYGDQSERPHYHAAIFGIGCRGYNPRYYASKRCDCEICTIVERSWKHGYVGVGTLENDSASYIAGYVQKTVKIDGKAIMGLTNIKDPLVNKWLRGRYQEFTRMSLKPGIGGDSVDAIVDTLTTDEGSEYVLQNGDVPVSLLHGTQSLPLGRYIREKVRKQYGFQKKTTLRGTVSYTPEESMRKLSEKKLEERKQIWDKAKSINKNPYCYEKEVKWQKIKNQEIKSSVNAKVKGEM